MQEWEFRDNTISSGKENRSRHSNACPHATGGKIRYEVEEEPGIKDQWRIVEAQRGASIRRIEKSDLTGDWLDS